MNAASVTVTAADPAAPEARALVAALVDELASLYPPEAMHYYDPVAGGGTGGVFMLACLGDRAVGCGALKPLDAATGELKRMYVAPEARRAGVGAALLDALEAEARARGLTRLQLETGVHQPAARALYERAGYVEVPCAGEYAATSADAGGLSVCYEKLLGRPAGR